MARKASFVFLCLLLATHLFAEPQVRQFDPPQSLLLGQPVYWIIEVRHPLSEAYELTLKAPAGATMLIEGRSDRRSGEQMISVYRIRITAQELALGAPPAAIVTGTQGAVVLTAKALQVHPISSDSLELRDPSRPIFPAVRSGKVYKGAGVAVALLLLAWIYLRIQRKRAATPRQVLLRRLNEALTRARRPADPAAMSRLFRSELLWGVPVDAATVTELRERAGQHPQLSKLSDALEHFESARYSGAVLRDPALIERSVHAALEVLQER